MGAPMVPSMVPPAAAIVAAAIKLEVLVVGGPAEVEDPGK